MCPGCGLSLANIRDDEFSCRGGLTNSIVYRAMIIGTDVYNPFDLVSLIQSWVSSGFASIVVQRSHLFLDVDCNAMLDTLSDPDCPLAEPPVMTTSAIPPRRTTQPSTTTGRPGVVSNAVASPIRAGVIGGILVATIIAALIAVLLVVLIVTILKWRTSKKKSSYDR